MSNVPEYLDLIKSHTKIQCNKDFLKYVLRHTLWEGLLFILVTYNIIFIPLQMGFSIKFNGVYLFMEIMTMLVYTIDAFLIGKNYRNLKKASLNLPLGGDDYQKRLISDKDEIDYKIRLSKVNFISTVIGAIPFSLILQNTNDQLFILNFLRVLRLVKIWPFYKLIQILKPINVHLIRLFEVVVTYYLVAHIVAGVMLSMGLTNKDITKTWLNRVPVPLPNGVRT